MQRTNKHTNSAQPYSIKETQIKTIILFFQLADWQRLKQTDVIMCW